MSLPIRYDPDGTPMREVWKIRVETAEVRPSGWFLANEKNWRIHPSNQRGALRGLLVDVGWVDSVKINRRSHPSWGALQGIPCLFDGHMRIEEALKEGEDVAIPLEYCDLTPAEEAEVLATLDPISAMAVASKDALTALLNDVSTTDTALQALISATAERAGVGLLAGDELIPDVDFKEYDESVADEVKYHECPNCGHKFPA